MLLRSFDKESSERLDYEIDLGPALAGDPVANISWRGSAPELVVGTGTNGLPGASLKGTKATVWVSGGVPGRFYTVNADVTTTGGRELSIGFGVQVTDSTGISPRTPASRGMGGLTTVPDPAQSPDLFWRSRPVQITGLVGGVGLTAVGFWLVGRPKQAFLGASLAAGGTLLLGLVFYAILSQRSTS